MKNNNIIHNQSWGWSTHTKVGIAEHFLFLYKYLVNFTAKTHYVWQGVVITISWWICNIKITMNLHYVYQDSKKNVIDQHSWPVGWLPKVIWLTTFLAKKKMLFVWHFWLASWHLTSKFECLQGNITNKNKEKIKYFYTQNIWAMFMTWQ